MNVRRLLAAALTLGALCLLGSPVPSQTLTTIRVATVPIDAGAEVFYAKEMGFFTKAGLNVEITPAANGGAVAAMVAGNAVDIGYSDMVSISSGFGKGVPFAVVAAAALHEAKEPINEIIVAANSPIRTAKDLNGKIIAGSGLGTISGFGPRAWIEANGGDLDSVKFVELPFPSMQPALDAGRIDAAMIAEPFLSQARKTERVIASPYDSIAKEFLISAYYTNAGYAKDHADALTRFASAIHETAVWANKNHARSAEILLANAKLDQSLVATMRRARYGERLDPAMMQPVINVAAKYSKFPPFAAADLIYKPAR